MYTWGTGLQAVQAPCPVHLYYIAHEVLCQLSRAVMLSYHPTQDLGSTLDLRSRIWGPDLGSRIWGPDPTSDLGSSIWDPGSGVQIWGRVWGWGGVQSLPLYYIPARAWYC